VRVLGSVKAKLGTEVGYETIPTQTWLTQFTGETPDLGGSVSSTISQGQTFRTGQWAVSAIVGVDLYTELGTGTGDIRVEIWSVNGSNLPLSLITSSTPHDENTLTDNGVTSFEGFGAVSLSPNTTYAIVVTGEDMTGGFYYTSLSSGGVDPTINHISSTLGVWSVPYPSRELLVDIEVIERVLLPGLKLSGTDNSTRRVGAAAGSSPNSFILPADNPATEAHQSLIYKNGGHTYAPMHRVLQYTYNSTIPNNNSNGIATTNIIMVDTSGGGGKTITLPSAPVVGDVYRFVDAAGTFNSSNLTVARNTGQNILGNASNVSTSVNHMQVVFIYVGGSLGWSANIGLG
jgi:hypothetical protein